MEKADIEACLPHVQAGKRILFMVDHPEQLKLLQKLAEPGRTTLSLCVDLDLSTHFPLLHFGVFRSPLRRVARADGVLVGRQVGHRIGSFDTVGLAAARKIALRFAADVAHGRDPAAERAADMARQRAANNSLRDGPGRGHTDGRQSIFNIVRSRQTEL